MRSASLSMSSCGKVPPDSRLTFRDHQENSNDDVHWLKVFVDAHSRAVFTYQEQIIPDNQTAVLAT